MRCISKERGYSENILKYTGLYILDIYQIVFIDKKNRIFKGIAQPKKFICHLLNMLFVLLQNTKDDILKTFGNQTVLAETDILRLFIYFCVHRSQWLPKLFGYQQSSEEKRKLFSTEEWTTWGWGNDHFHYFRVNYPFENKSMRFYTLGTDWIAISQL